VLHALRGQRIFRAAHQGEPIVKTDELMTRTVASCRPEDPLEVAAQLMWEWDVGCVVVTDPAQRPIGMITDRDLAMAAYTQGALLRDIRVETVMAKKIWACSVNTSLKEVEDKMRTAQVRRLPVMGLDGELVGIITLGDIARSSQSSPLRLTEIPGLAKTLASITERRWPDSAVTS
jgi:predicted transcriptional regulator